VDLALRLLDHYHRPEPDAGWHNTGPFVPPCDTSCFILDVIPGCDVQVRCFALNAHGWSAPSEVSSKYWLPDTPFAEESMPRAMRVSVSPRCPPPLQLQVQVCALDIRNGAPLVWRPTPP
jgi:hypothetical protein